MKTVAILAAFMALASAQTSIPHVAVITVGAKGVVINDITIDDITSIFEFNNADNLDDIFNSVEEFKAEASAEFMVRQPRLNHKVFTVTVDVKSDVATVPIFQFFLGPKYDSNGYTLSIEDNWEEFVQLDVFVQRLTPGQNIIRRIYQPDSPLSLRLPEVFENEGLSLVVYVTKLI